MPTAALMENLAIKERLYRDPAYNLVLAEDQARGGAILVQQLWHPGIAGDSLLLRQAEALAAVELSLIGRGPELNFQSGAAILRREWPEGHYLSAIAETQRDEIYLRRLDSALRILWTYHRAGLWHLAQNPHSWILQNDAEGTERLRLLDLPLFPDLPLGARVYPEAVVALAPELLLGDTVDGRADLYALACLILRQRSPRAFERVGSVSQYLDLHLGGRVADLVPKTPSPLNQFLRRMLQREPTQRPADASEALRELGAELAMIRPSEASADGPKPRGWSPPSLTPEAADPPPDWAEARARRRRATLSFSLIHQLQDEEDPRASELLERLPADLAQAYVPETTFLRAREAQRKGDLDSARRQLHEAAAASPLAARLRVELSLAAAELCPDPVPFDKQASLLIQAWDDARLLPDEEPAAEVLLARARLELSRDRQAEALPLLHQAWLKLGDAVVPLLQERIGTALVEVLGACGAFERAWRVSAKLLSLPELRDPAQAEIMAGLVLTGLQRPEPAQEYFSRAKSRISAQKDLPRLLWACGHELRGLLAKGDGSTAGREWKILKSRARAAPEMQGFLEMLELKLWLGAGRDVAVAAPAFFEEALATGRLERFRECLWPVAESEALLAEAAQRCGRERDSQGLAERARAWRERMKAALADLGEVEPTVSERPVETAVSRGPDAAEPPAPVLPAPTAEPGPEVKALRSMQRENFLLRQENERLSGELEQLKSALAKSEVPASHPSEQLQKISDSVVDLSTLREAAEKRSIVASLRRHLGNRLKASRELQIHRRTLFEKIRRYGLAEEDFLPSPRELEEALRECRGNKSLAAERLGMSRSSFYRWLKNRECKRGDS